MSTRKILTTVCGGLALAGFLGTGEAMAQRGREGGLGGGRSAGYRAPTAGGQLNRGPSMSRPNPGAGGFQRPNTLPAEAGGGFQRPGGVPNAGGFQRPATLPAQVPGGLQRPGVGAPGAGGLQRPVTLPAEVPGGLQRPGGVPGAGGFQRPSTLPAEVPGGFQRPGTYPGGAFARPGGGASAGQINDFLGIPGQPASRPLPATRPDVVNRPNLGQQTNIGAVRPNFGQQNVTNVTGNVVNRNPTTNINVGNVNIGNQVNYTENRQAWVSQRQTWGNNVRVGTGNRYNNVFNDNWFRQPPVGGVNYWGGWAGRGPYYAWTPAVWAGVGAFFGASMARAQPVYYGYGTGGNVYYENNVVYVNGQPAGTPK